MNPNKNDLGTIRIHKKVISTIANTSAKEIEGVSRLGSSLRSNLSSLFYRKDGSVEVTIDKNNEVSITIPVVVKYGFNLPDVATQIQENVRRMIEKSTDLTIKDININIQEVEKEAQ